jgi:HAD superfamily hydrolase (TIGR01549 family)
MLKRIYFDFGGCLDAPGIHTRTLFWDAFQDEGLVHPDSRAEFQEAYTVADQRMMANGEAASLGLEEFNRHNAKLIAEFGGLDQQKCSKAGDRVTSLMRGYLEQSKAELAPFAENYSLSIISNFTGNLELILKEFGLRNFFSSVTESYYAGASKPDLRIFQTALGKHAERPEECMYVGDNPVNDIAPARQLGMKTALIHPPGKRRDCGASYYVEDLRALFSAIQSR